MSFLRCQIELIIADYPGTRITDSGKRTIEEQIRFVKERPSEYPKTLDKLFKDFHLDIRKCTDEKYLETIYDGKEEWLRKTILKFASENTGYQHISGNAIDISVRSLDFFSKQQLRDELIKKGYHIILEFVSKRKSKYYVELHEANVFHVDLLNARNRQPAIEDVITAEITGFVKFGSPYQCK